MGAEHWSWNEKEQEFKSTKDYNKDLLLKSAMVKSDWQVVRCRSYMRTAPSLVTKMGWSEVAQSTSSTIRPPASLGPHFIWLITVS